MILFWLCYPFPTVSDHTSTWVRGHQFFVVLLWTACIFMTFFLLLFPSGLFYTKELHTGLNSLNIRLNVLFLVTSFVFCFFLNTNGRHPSIDVSKSSIFLYTTFGNLIFELFLAKVLGFSQISKAGPFLHTMLTLLYLFMRQAPGQLHSFV